MVYKNKYWVVKSAYQAGQFKLYGTSMIMLKYYERCTKYCRMFSSKMSTSFLVKEIFCKVVNLPAVKRKTFTEDTRSIENGLLRHHCSALPHNFALCMFQTNPPNYCHPTFNHINDYYLLLWVLAENNGKKLYFGQRRAEKSS